MTPSAGAIALLVLVVAGAAFLNGASGFGFAIVAVAGFATVLDPQRGVVLLSIITPVLTTQQLHLHWDYRSAAGRLRAVLPAGIVGSAIGTQLLLVLPGYVLEIALGLVAGWYAIGSMRSSPLQLRPGRERLLSPLVGLAAGIANAAVGAAGPVLGSYLLAIGLRGREWIFAISLAFWVVSIGRVVALAVAEQYQVGIVVLGLGLLVPMYLAQASGFALQSRFSVSTFQKVVLVVLLVASANLLVRGMSDVIAVWTA